MASASLHDFLLENNGLRQENAGPRTDLRRGGGSPDRAVENSLHRVLDETMGGEALRNRKDSGPGNLALMRRLALNLARLTDGGRVTSVRGRLKRAGWDDGFLLKPVSSATGLAAEAEPEKIQLR